MPNESERQSEAARSPAIDATSLESAALAKAIVATATEGMVAIDVEGRIELVNRAVERLFGFGPGELLGQHVSVLMPSPYREEHDAYVRRYLATAEPHIIGIGREVVGRRRDGSMFPIDLSVGEGFVGNRRFFVAIIRDITDRKEMQARLALAERLTAIGELAAGVAHEINNPINTILNCAQLIRDGDSPIDNADVITSESQRVAAIVHDLLGFARDDREPLQRTDLDVVIQHTVRLLREKMRTNGIAVELRLGANVPPIMARPQQLQQVLLNLLINAKDALLTSARSDRVISLETAVDHGGVTLTVRDNGPGIPATLGARIFEPFVTTKRGRGGTGLGLPISRSIVEDLGGTIAIGEGTDVGAAFRIWLPLPSEAPVRAHGT